MKKILILGGNGFIGSNLCRYLSDEYQIRCLDLSNKNISDINSLEFIKGDWLDSNILSHALHEVDIVVHLISTTVPGTSNQNMTYDVQSNLVGSLHLFNAMVKANVRRIIYLSSGGTIYGNQQHERLNEEVLPRPMSSYAVVKLAIENYLHIYSQQFDFSSSILRVSNPYGMGSNKIGIQGLIPTIFNQLVSDEPITLWGNGQNIRDYIYIDDLARAIQICIDHEHKGVFNIGSGMGHSSLELINMIEELTGVSSKLKFEPARSFDVQRIVLDCSKANSSLKWQTRITLHEGLERYWSQLKANIR